MRPKSKQKLEILKVEMGLIQGTFDKYDDLIFRNRNWFITMWVAANGLAFTIGEPRIVILAALASFLYWFTEGMMRHQYWYKYVVRYRAIREWLNSSSEKNISIYDLTNHYGDGADRWTRLKASFLKLEPTLLSLIMLLSSWVIYGFVPDSA